MSQREVFLQEIKRLRQARRRSRSHHLKTDYEKAIRRKEKQLALYDILQKTSIRRKEHA